MKKAARVILSLAVLFYLGQDVCFSDYFTVYDQNLTSPVYLNNPNELYPVSFNVWYGLGTDKGYGPPYNLTSATANFSFRDNTDPKNLSATIEYSFTTGYSEEYGLDAVYTTVNKTTHEKDPIEIMKIMNTSGQVLDYAVTPYWDSGAPIFQSTSTDVQTVVTGLNKIEIPIPNSAPMIIYLPILGVDYTTINNFTHEEGYTGDVTKSISLDASSLASINSGVWQVTYFVSPYIGDAYLTSASLTFNATPYVAPTTTPEPFTMLLLGFGFIGLAGARRLRQ